MALFHYYLRWTSDCAYIYYLPTYLQDCNGHGTHCGGIAAGSTYGVASQAIIHSVRVLKCDGNGSNSAVITGNMFLFNRSLHEKTHKHILNQYVKARLYKPVQTC